MLKTRKHQDLLMWAAVLLAAIVWSSCLPDTSPGPRVVLVTIDTLRADHLGYHGYPRDTSPFLDELAQDSAVFARAIASSSQTGPSHASILTSLYPGQHGLLFNGMSLKAAVPTAAEAFASAGIPTAGHVAVGFLNELRAGFGAFTAESRSAPEIIDAAIAWTDSLGPSEPYFLWLHFFDVHESKEQELSEEGLLHRRRVVASADLSESEWIRFLRTEHGLTEEGASFDGLLPYIDRYDAQISYVDAELKRFHFALAERGLLRESLWVVTADHGQGLGSHSLLGHGGKIWNEQVHAPLIMHFANGAHAGKRLDQVVRHVDLMPTLLEFAGLSLPRSEHPLEHPLEGRSVMPLLRGEPDEERLAISQRRPPIGLRANPELVGRQECRDSLMLEMGQFKVEKAEGPRTWTCLLHNEMIAIQNSTHKYIRLSRATDHFFDLRTDPLEQHDLIELDAPEKDFLLQKLSQVYLRLNPLVSPIDVLDINPEHMQELKALGYID